MKFAFFVCAVAILFLFAVGAARADDDSPLSAATLVELLRLGGFSLYFRHEATDWSQSDSIRKPNDWLSCDGSRIRQLSEAGRQQAVATGNAIRSLGIPVGEVLGSPYCRTLDTAGLLNLGSVEASTDVVNMRVAEYFGGRDAVIETARALLASAPPAAANRVIVSHGNVARNATGVYPAEGEAIIFEADGMGGFSFIGRLTAADWQAVASGD